VSSCDQIPYSNGFPASSIDGRQGREPVVSESVYKVIELVGTSPESWEKAAAAAVEVAAKSLEDLRIAEIADLDMHIGEQGEIVAYRAKVKVSFKFRSDD
jgi:hypothetical protein